MANQTLCLQYLVTGELDGLTPAPELAAPRSTGDENQIYKPEAPVERLGLIDPDFTPEGPATGISNRLLTFIWITGAEPGDPDARVAIVDPEDPTDPLLQELVADMSGETRLYVATGVFLPQGSALQIRGLRPAAGQEIKVRLYVDILDDALATATALEAICCAADAESVASIELMAGPPDFRGPDFSYVSGVGVESFVTDRQIAGIDFNAFRLSPVGSSQATWSYTLPRRNRAPGTYSVTVTLEWSDDPAPSFAGALQFGLADQPEDLAAVVFAAATDVQVVAVGNAGGRVISVLEWTFSNPSAKPLVACVLTQPGGGGPIMYIYEATLRYVGP